jgi:hypothetical protein
MGKPTRNKFLAEYYLRAAGVAAVWIDATCHVGAQDVASIEIEPRRAVFCCPRGAQYVLAYRLQLWMQEQAERPDQAAIAIRLEELAEAGGVGLTPHAIAVDRALAVVATVNETFEKAASNGELREMNAPFKAARAVDPSMRYQDFVHAKKTAMLEALALA